MRSHHKANRFHFEPLEPRRLLSFAALLAFDTGSSAACVAAGDVNGDGLLDLVTANAGGGGTVSVLLGNGDGSFRARQTFDGGTDARSVVLGDVNGDGRLDLAVATPFVNTVSVLVGNGDGTFQDARTFSAGVSPIFVAVGHF